MSPGGVWAAPAGLSWFSALSYRWRWVGDEVKSACSQVAAAEQLLNQTLASIGWNILRPIRVSLKK
jgi:hypothetical protein